MHEGFATETAGWLESRKGGWPAPPLSSLPPWVTPRVSTHRLHGARQGVRSATSVEALRGALGQMEAALSPAHLSPQFARAPALVRGAWPLPGATPFRAPSPVCRHGLDHNTRTPDFHRADASSSWPGPQHLGPLCWCARVSRTPTPPFRFITVRHCPPFERQRLLTTTPVLVGRRRAAFLSRGPPTTAVDAGHTLPADVKLEAAFPLPTNGAATPPEPAGAPPPAAAAAADGPAGGQPGPPSAAAPAENGLPAMEPLAWLPATVAAVAFRLATLDAAVLLEPGAPPMRERLQVTPFRAPPSGVV